MNTGCEIPITATFFKIRELYQRIVVEMNMDIATKDISEVKYHKLPVMYVDSGILCDITKT